VVLRDERRRVVLREVHYGDGLTALSDMARDAGWVAQQGGSGSTPLANRFLLATVLGFAGWLFAAGAITAWASQGGFNAWLVTGVAVALLAASHLLKRRVRKLRQAQEQDSS
jgi:hypothetical protein